MKYFKGINNVDDLKKAYKELVKKLHPDNGGDVEEFKAMQSEFSSLFDRLKNVRKSANGGTYTKESNETANEFMDIINKLLKIPAITVELCGTWIWISGNTYSHKEELKKAGCRYASKKKMWYIPGESSSSHKPIPMEKIRERYGSISYESEEQKALA